MRTPAAHLLRAVVIASLVAAACAGSTDAPTAEPTAAPSTSAPDTNGTATAATAATTSVAATAPITAPVTAPVALPIDVDVTVTGDEEVVFDASEQACGDFQRPDLPARAFRSADGLTSIIMSAPNNTRLVGPSLDEVAVTCDVIRGSSYDHDPAAHGHFEWIAAVATDDGETIHAVIHNEYHGYEASLADSRRALLNDYGDVGWTYLARTGSGTIEMTPAESGVRFGSTLCAIDFWGAHPDVGCDALRRFAAPFDGPVVVDVRARRAAAEGDGVTVSVERGDEALLSVVLDAPGTIVDERLTLDMATGDTLDFVVAAGADSSFDGTEFTVVITPDGDVCEGDVWGCQHVELTASVSTDGGATFSPTTGASSLIASPGVQYQHDAGLVALWQPSNIVRHPTDGHFYMLTQFDDRQERGVQLTCLLRTATLDDPSSWRAWDGTGFELSFTSSPYAAGTDAPEDCVSVVPPPIGGLTWNTHLDRFVAIAGYNNAGPNGQYLTTSTDLINWTDPVFIQAAEFVYTQDRPPFEPYATLIDPSSESLSYDTTGATPYMYFTRINGMDPLDFDLLRVPLRLDVSSG